MAVAMVAMAAMMVVHSGSEWQPVSVFRVDGSFRKAQC